jgi:MOSC domain-containing protein YiiM
MVKRFLHSGRTGFYLGVAKQGEVGPGDRIDLLRRAEGSVTVAELTNIYLHKKSDRRALERVLQVRELPDGWRRYLTERLEKTLQESVVRGQ